MVEMQNGCICCTLRDEFMNEIERLAADKSIEAIFVEASGISEPSSIAGAFVNYEESTDTRVYLKTEYKTKARAALLEFLKENSDRGFSAIDLLTYLQLNIDGVNKTTVYRNLDRLCEQGGIYKYRESDHEGWFYQYSKEHTHCNSHMHGKCSMCGKLFHIEDDFGLDFEKRVKKTYGFQIDLRKTLIVGVCSECI